MLVTLNISQQTPSNTQKIYAATTQCQKIKLLQSQNKLLKTLLPKLNSLVLTRLEKIWEAEGEKASNASDGINKTNKWDVITPV